MRYLLFVAASTSHALGFVSPSGVRPATRLAGRSLFARTYLGGSWQLPVLVRGRTPIAVSTRHTHWRGG